MLGELLEKLGELFSDGGDGGYDHNGHDAIMGGMEYSGIDLSAYSPDEIEEALKSAFGTDGGAEHVFNGGHDISFGAAPDVDARNVAKSALIDKLDTNHIYTSSLTTDDLWGGLDSYSGDKVYDAINSARDNDRISDTVYRELMALLKKACHTQ